MESTTNTTTTTTTTPTVIYDKYDFIVAYVLEGRLEIEETSQIWMVKKGSYLENNIEDATTKLRSRYEKEYGDNDSGGHGFLFEYIYKGCERIVEEVA